MIDVTDRLAFGVRQPAVGARRQRPGGLRPAAQGAVGHVPIGGREYQVSVRESETCACLDGLGRVAALRIVLPIKKSCQRL